MSGGASGCCDQRLATKSRSFQYCHMECPLIDGNIHIIMVIYITYISIKVLYSTQA